MCQDKYTSICGDTTAKLIASGGASGLFVAFMYHVSKAELCGYAVTVTDTLVTNGAAALEWPTMQLDCEYEPGGEN